MPRTHRAAVPFQYTTTPDEDRGLAYRVRQWNDPKAHSEGQPWTPETVFARLVAETLAAHTVEADSVARRELAERLQKADPDLVERVRTMLTAEEQKKDAE